MISVKFTFIHYFSIIDSILLSIFNFSTEFARNKKLITMCLVLTQLVSEISQFFCKNVPNEGQHKHRLLSSNFRFLASSSNLLNCDFLDRFELPRLPFVWFVYKKKKWRKNIFLKVIKVFKYILCFKNMCYLVKS